MFDVTVPLSRIKCAVIAFAVTFALFLPSFRGHFIAIDDHEYVINNQYVKTGLSVENVKWAFNNVGYADNWHPLTWTSLMCDVSIANWIFNRTTASDKDWETNGKFVARIMHAHNILLHALNTLLLFLLLCKLVHHRVSPYWLLGFTLLWSLHPLRVEVVCWITERKELLSAFFMLLALMAYCDDHITWVRYCLALPFSALAMAAKPVAVTLPVVLLAWDWVIRKKFSLWKITPFFGLSGLICLLTLMSQTSAIATGQDLPLASRLNSIFVAPLVYLKQSVLPINLSLVYPNSDHLNVYLLAIGIAVVILLAAVSVAWLFGHRGRLMAIFVFGISWIYVGLLPMLGIIKVGSQEHSDRYTYWIGCGLVAVFAMLIDFAKPHIPRVVAFLNRQGVTEDWQKLRGYLSYGLMGLVAVYGIAASVRVSIWRDPIGLLRDAAEKSWNPDATSALASSLALTGERGHKEGEWWLRKCVNMNHSASSLINLAQYLLTKPVEMIGIADDKPYAESEDLLREALFYSPENAQAKKLLQGIETYRKQIK